MEKIDLTTEVKVVIAERLAAKQPVPTAWVVDAVLSRHTEIRGGDSDWYRHYAVIAVTDAVNRQLRADKLKPEAELDAAQKDLFPGYTRIQARYVVARDGQQLWVDVDLLTLAEREEKLGQMERGLSEHRKELERYFAAHPIGEVA